MKDVMETSTSARRGASKEQVDKKTAVESLLVATATKEGEKAADDLSSSEVAAASAAAAVVAAEEEAAEEEAAAANDFAALEADWDALYGVPATEDELIEPQQEHLYNEGDRLWSTYTDPDERDPNQDDAADGFSAHADAAADVEQVSVRMSSHADADCTGKSMMSVGSSARLRRSPDEELRKSLDVARRSMDVTVDSKPSQVTEDSAAEAAEWNLDDDSGADAAALEAEANGLAAALEAEATASAVKKEKEKEEKDKNDVIAASSFFTAAAAAADKDEEEEEEKEEEDDAALFSEAGALAAALEAEVVTGRMSNDAKNHLPLIHTRRP